MKKLILNSIVKVHSFDYYTKIGGTKSSNDEDYELYDNISEIKIVNTWIAGNGLEYAWAIPISEKLIKFLEKNSKKGISEILKNILSYRQYDKDFLNYFDDKYVLYINELNLVK